MHFFSQYLHIFKGFYWFQSQLILIVQSHMYGLSDLCNCDCELNHSKYSRKPYYAYLLPLSLGMAILLVQQCNCYFVMCSTCSYSKTFVKTLRVQEMSTSTREKAERRLDVPFVF